MHILAHRGIWKTPAEKNSHAAVRAAFEAGFGLETDLRSHDGKIFLSHDPITTTKNLVSFETLLAEMQKFPTAPVFLNVKEDGLTPLLESFRAELDNANYVFFDYSVPEMVRYAKVFPAKNLATRFSEYEMTPSGLDLCDWIWVDGFQRDPATSEVTQLIATGKNLAVVSSELHGRTRGPLWADTLLAAIFRTEKSAQQLALCTDLPFDAKKLLKY